MSDRGWWRHLAWGALFIGGLTTLCDALLYVFWLLPRGITPSELPLFGLVALYLPILALVLLRTRAHHDARAALALGLGAGLGALLGKIALGLSLSRWSSDARLQTFAFSYVMLPRVISGFVVLASLGAWLWRRRARARRSPL